MTTEEFKRNILKMQPRLQRMAEYIVGDPDSAADAVQEAVISWWEQRSMIKSQEMEKLSLTMVKRRSIDLLRKQKPTVSVDAESLMLAEPPQDDLEERYYMARQLVDRLPVRQRDVILMKYEEGLSFNTQHLGILHGIRVFTNLLPEYKPGVVDGKIRSFGVELKL